MIYGYSHILSTERSAARTSKIMKSSEPKDENENPIAELDYKELISEIPIDEDVSSSFDLLGIGFHKLPLKADRISFWI